MVRSNMIFLPSQQPQSQNSMYYIYVSDLTPSTSVLDLTPSTSGSHKGLIQLYYHPPIRNRYPLHKCSQLVYIAKYLRNGD